MAIEIIARDTCPTCGGICAGRGFSCCNTCHGQRGIVTVLATFADEATLRKKINNAVGFSIGDLGSVSGTTVRSARDAVLAELGIDDHPQPPTLVD